MNPRPSSDCRFRELEGGARASKGVDTPEVFIGLMKPMHLLRLEVALGQPRELIVHLLPVPYVQHNNPARWLVDLVDHPVVSDS